MKKALTAALSLLILTAAFLSGCASGNGTGSIAEQLIPEYIKPEPMTLVPAYGMTAALGKLTYGLSSAGLLSYTGRTNGRAACYDWRGIVYVEAFEDYTLGLTEDGRVLIAGTSEAAKDAAAKTADWKDLVCVCRNEQAVFGLTGQGRILSTEADARLRLIKGIRLIAAGGRWFAAADGRGVVYTFGEGAPDVSALIGKKLASWAASGTHIAAVTTEGELISTLAGDPLTGSTDCAKVFTCSCGGGCTTYISKDGKLHSSCPQVKDHAADLEAAGGAHWFSCSGSHAAVSFESGTVLSFGENDFLQCSTKSWRLLPFSQDGFVYGIAPGTKAPDGSPVKTGDSFTLPGGTSGTAVILGDVDCDGDIDADDLAALTAAIKDASALSPAAKQAANILRDSAKPSSIDRADLDQLSYHLKGFTIIDQFLKADPYLKKVADAERTNKDVGGYITLSGTNIDAPIMYGDDWFYHYHNWKGASDRLGSIYYYYDVPTRNLVITGHNIRRGLILHDLHKIQDYYAKYYKTFEKRLWTINTWGETGIYEVFSMYEEKPKDPRETSQYYNTNYPQSMEQLSTENIARWIAFQQQKSQLDYQVEVDPSDRFITVLTCADLHAESELGGRLYFFLRRVDGH